MTAMPENTKYNFTTYVTVFLLFVTVGRVHELFPMLEGVPIAKIALFIGFLSVFLSRNKLNNKIQITPILKYILLLFGLAILSVGFSVYKTESLNFVTTSILGLLLLMYLMLKTCSNYQVIKLYSIVLVFCSAALAYGVVSGGAGDRLSVGETLDPNDLALFLLTILPIAFTLIFVTKKHLKLILSGIVAILLLGIILTGSRGGFIGLVVVAMLLLIQRFPKEAGGYARRFTIKKLLLIIAGILVMYNFAPDEYWERISTLLNPTEDYNMNDDRGRVAIWSQGIDMTLEFPWGVGVAAFSSGQGMLEGGYYQTAHNSLIQIAGELGFLGLMLYLILYVKALLNANNIAKNESNDVPIYIRYAAIGLRTGLVGFFVSSFFLSQAYSPLLYVIYTLIDRISYLIKEKIDVAGRV